MEVPLAVEMSARVVAWRKRWHSLIFFEHVLVRKGVDKGIHKVYIMLALARDG